ncbi:GNAT family N-acetyltransferase [Microcoleus sp. MON1_C5]|uniref:GNAT family N-acetyltransferase n=1 Tax=Microcoleus sp. MON1_C5 TaxID=2818828 RepID=UPI002FD29CEB
MALPTSAVFAEPENQEIIMEHIVRKYEDKDLNEVLSSWENASRIADPFLTKEFIEQERYNILNIYLPNAETWVVEQKGQVLGFIALLGNEVGGIFVKPEFQGTGAGRALMDHAQKLRGDLEVEVFKANSIGRKFYGSYGFKMVSEKVHEQTGNELLRLKFTADNA